ncbi:MAG: hypothetical protein ACYDAR_19770 [Thermomicrobiales bacterium]
MWIEWRVRWRGDAATVRWENGTLTSDNAVTAAFGRFAVSNAPTTDRPTEERLHDPVIVAHMLAEFADAIVERTDG